MGSQDYFGNPYTWPRSHKGQDRCLVRSMQFKMNKMCKNYLPYQPFTYQRLQNKLNYWFKKYAEYATISNLKSFLKPKDQTISEQQQHMKLHVFLIFPNYCGTTTLQREGTFSCQSLWCPLASSVRITLVLDSPPHPQICHVFHLSAFLSSVSPPGPFSWALEV